MPYGSIFICGTKTAVKAQAHMMRISRDLDLPTTGLVFDDRYLAHNTGLAIVDTGNLHPFAEPVPHVSSPALVGRAKQLIGHYGISDQMVRVTPYEADDASLLRYHTTDYLERVRLMSQTGGDAGQGAPLGIGGDRIARLATGGVMAAVDAVMTGGLEAAYALVRPPGHHAMADKGMGFCIFNNVVVAAKHAQTHFGVEKILILDWDVHHGNGTQDALYHDPSVLFISIHQDDLYPVGWGAADHIGEGSGEGFTVNIPLPGGTGSEGYLEAFSRIVMPISLAFDPDLIIVSAGQDASVVDPLARMALTTSTYRAMTRAMMDIAGQCCNGRLVIAQEGGYAAAYAPYCSAAIAETLTAPPEDLARVHEPYGPRAETMPSALTVGLDAERAIQRVVDVQAPFWGIE
jgi:acetoin utilization deacetylase AcuC-like enzyme